MNDDSSEMFRLDGVDMDEPAASDELTPTKDDDDDDDLDDEDDEEEEDEEDEEEEASSSCASEPGEDVCSAGEVRSAGDECLKQLSLPIQCADRQRAYHNLRELDVLKKTSLVYLIERNRERSQICCPFDELAYVSLDVSTTAPVAAVASATASGSAGVIASRAAELVRVRPALLKQLESMQLARFDPASAIGTTGGLLLPNCVSSLAMPFFFDIIQPSELRLFSAAKCEILRSLRRAYVPQQHLADRASLLKYMCENVLWSCFALFNYKFHAAFRVGFVNYLLSLFCLIEHLSGPQQTEHAELVRQLRQLAPCYLEALVLNGFVTSREFAALAELSHRSTPPPPPPPIEPVSNAASGSSVNVFACSYGSTASLASSSSLEPSSEPRRRVSEAFAPHSALERAREHYLPLSLKALCRIAVKGHMKEFSAQQVCCAAGRLPLLSDELKAYMLFDDEFAKYYQESRAFLKPSNDWF